MRTLKKLLLAGLSAILMNCPLPSAPNPPEVKNELSENTHVLDSTQAAMISSVSDNSIIFSQAQNYSVGDIIVSDITPQTLDGLLRKVSSISPDGMIINTQQATLEDAVKNVSFASNKSLFPKSTSLFSNSRAANSLNLIDTDIVNLDNFVIYDIDGNPATTNDQIIVKSGNIHLSSDVYLELKIEEHILKEFTLKNITSDSASFQVNFTFDQANINVWNTVKKIPLPSFTLGYLPTTPPLPIIIKPNLEIIAGAVGDVSVTSDAGLSQNASLTLGINYNRGTWAPIADITNQFNYQLPTISGLNSLKVYAGANMNLFLYGVAGPYGNLNAYLKLNSSPDSLGLYGGLEGNLGIRGEILGRNLLNYSIKVLDYNKQLYYWEKAVPKYKILFSSGPTNIVTSADYPQIYTIDSDGANLKKLTNFNYYNFSDYSACWSPDGTKIAFVGKQDGNKEIYAMNIDGTNLKRLTNNAADDIEPDWSPDGTKIVFVTSRNYYHEIWTMNADGTGQQVVPNAWSISDDPRWSPDGNKIIYSSYNGIDVINKDGTNSKNITSSGSWPSYSQNGNKIVFEKNWEIYIMNSDGSGEVNLTNNSAIDAFPSWSSDGSKIVFTSNRYHSYNNIHIMNSDGSSVQRIATLDSSQDQSPRYSPVPVQ